MAAVRKLLVVETVLLARVAVVGCPHPLVSNLTCYCS